MSLHSPIASRAVSAGACTAIVGLAFAAYLSLPETLLYNDYVSGAILGGTIVLVSGVVRVAHPHGGDGGPAGPDR